MPAPAFLLDDSAEADGGRSGFWRHVSPALRGPQFLLDERAARHIEGFLNRARLVLVGCILALADLELLYGLPRGSIVPLAIGGLAWVGLIALLIRRWYRPWVAILISLIDVGCISALIFLTGGPRSSLDLLYAVTIFAASLRFTRTHSFIFTVVVLLSYVEVNILHPLFVPAIHSDQIITRAIILAATGILAWLIASEVERQRRAIIEASQELASLSTIAEISQAVNASVNRGEVIHSAVGLVDEILKPHGIALSLYDEENRLQLQIARGDWKQQSGGGGTSEAATDQSAIEREMREGGCTEVIVAPLGVVGRPFGYLFVGCHADAAPRPADHALVQRIAEDTSTALQRAYLLDRERERSRALARLAEDNGRLLASERDRLARLRQLATHKDGFIAMIAHELRTPLTSIKGYAQLLVRSRTASTDHGRFTDVILAQSNRMIDIIDEIVDLSRMERGLLEMRQERVATSALIHEVMGQLDPRRVNVTTEAEHTLPIVLGDPDKLRQTIVNLLLTGAKYHAGDGPMLMRAWHEENDVRIAVQIEGTIPHQRLAHIFEQLPDAETEELPRSGLGLYIAKNYVEAHGGELWIEREQDRGAFGIRIPVIVESARARYVEERRTA